MHGVREMDMCKVLRGSALWRGVSVDLHGVSGGKGVCVCMALMEGTYSVSEHAFNYVCMCVLYIYVRVYVSVCVYERERCVCEEVGCKERCYKCVLRHEPGNAGVATRGGGHVHAGSAAFAR